MCRWLVAGLLAGCYAPAPPAGAPCVDGVCPTGLVCSPATNTCETSAEPTHDAALDGPSPLIDAPLTTVDAPPDAPKPFLYRRRITIQTGSAALPTGYTIRVQLNNTLATLVSQGKAKADFADVRVIGDAPLGERNRIIDVAPAPSALNFSLQQSVAANTSNQSYYVYYGNPNAVAAPANGTQVFTLYDDFNAGIASFWLKNDAPTTSNGKLVLRAAHTDAITTNAANDGVPIVSAVELSAATTNPTSDPTVQPEGTFYYWWGYQHTGDFSASSPWVIWIARGKGAITVEQNSPVGCESGCGVGGFTQNTALRYYAIERDSNATRFYLDGALQYTANVTNNADYSLMVRNYQATGDVQVDWIRARARVTPEPVVTLGAEETL